VHPINQGIIFALYRPQLNHLIEPALLNRRGQNLNISRVSRAQTPVGINVIDIDDKRHSKLRVISSGVARNKFDLFVRTGLDEWPADMGRTANASDQHRKTIKCRL